MANEAQNKQAADAADKEKVESKAAETKAPETTGEKAAEQKDLPPKKKIDPELQRQKKEEHGRRSRRRNRQILGFVLSILVVVGAVSIVISGINLVQGMLSDTSELQEYEVRLEPMVWFDVLPFDSIDQVDENTLKQIAIWGVLNEQGQDIERTELGEPLVPSVDVDLYAAGLFGANFHFSGHESFIDTEYDLRYGYDATTGLYTAPATSLMPPYIPAVVEIIREPGGIKRVVVGYVSTMGSDDQLIATPDRDHPTRYMDYIFQRDGNQYYLTAMQPNTTYVPAASSGLSQQAQQSPPSSELLPPASVAEAPLAGEESTAENTLEDTAADGTDSSDSSETAA